MSILAFNLPLPVDCLTALARLAYPFSSAVQQLKLLLLMALFPSPLVSTSPALPVQLIS
jgi:hypothetical protein